MSLENAQSAEITSILSGASFPEETITVFMDAKTMYDYAKAKREWDFDPKNKDKEKAVNVFETVLDSLALHVTVKDVPQYKRTGVLKTLRKVYPPTTNVLGELVDTEECLDEYTANMWALYITRIKSGAVDFSPSVADIKVLKENAPSLTLKVIADAINKLTEEAVSGYEQYVKSLDFLSPTSQGGEAPSTATP